MFTLSKQLYPFRKDIIVDFYKIKSPIYSDRVNEYDSSELFNVFSALAEKKQRLI